MVMKKLLVVFLAAGLLFSGCAAYESLSPEARTGIGIGAVAGGILGAVVDSDRPWRGAIIGAAAGGALGGWIGHTMEGEPEEVVVEADADVVTLAAEEAAKQNVVVKYSRVTEDGVLEEIIATPGALVGSMRRVTVEYFRDGELVSKEIRDVAV